MIGVTYTALATAARRGAVKHITVNVGRSAGRGQVRMGFTVDWLQEYARHRAAKKGIDTPQCPSDHLNVLAHRISSIMALLETAGYDRDRWSKMIADEVVAFSVGRTTVPQDPQRPTEARVRTGTLHRITADGDSIRFREG